MPLDRRFQRKWRHPYSLPAKPLYRDFKYDICDFKYDICDFKYDICDFKYDNCDFKYDICDFKYDICDFKYDICDFKYDICDFKYDICDFKYDICDFKYDICDLKYDICHFKCDICDFKYDDFKYDICDFQYDICDFKYDICDFNDAPALSPPSPLQQGGQSSNAPALSPPSPLPQGSQPIALALSPSSPLRQDGQPSDAPGLSPSSSTLLLCPSDSTLSICHLNSQSAVKTEPSDSLAPEKTNSRRTTIEGPHQKGQASPHLPPEVTQVPRETVRTFAHHKKVGAYLLGRSLGEGSFAKVKEGLHLTTGEKVAVKVIDKKRAQTDRYVRKNLRREGRLLQQIRHNHVIQLLEVMETEHCYYLVTDYCAGGDLVDYITKRKRLDETEAKRFMRQVVSAVDYLHRLGIIHRDLKIENMLLDENRNIKLIDFGLSNTIKVSTAPEGNAHAQEYLVTQCGSPAYAAPELLNHEKYGLPADIWSIGVNLYAMLTGSLPFTVDPFNIRTLHDKMVSGQMNPLPPGLSTEAKDLLRKLLRAEPEQRLTITEILRHPWLAEGRNKSMPRAPFPNKLKSSDLNTPVLKHMSYNLDFRLSETIRYVVGNTPSSACATYHLYHRKLQRHLAALEAQGRACSDAMHLDEVSGRASLLTQETTTTSNPTTTNNTHTETPQSEEYVQKEVLTSDNTPLLQSRRKTSDSTKTTGVTTRPSPIKTAPGRRERICLFSVDQGLEEPHISTKENQDHHHHTRREKTQPCTRFHPLVSRPQAEASTSTPRHAACPAVTTSLKTHHLHLAVGACNPSRAGSPPATPRRMGTRPSTVIAATLLSSGLSSCTRRERTLAPINNIPAGTRRGQQREALKESVRDSIVDTLYAVHDSGKNGKKGTLVLRTNHPATTTATSMTVSSSLSPAENGVTQHVLQKRYQQERWRRSAHTKTNAEAGEVIQVTPLKGVRDLYSKRPVSSQMLPAIRQSLNKHPRNIVLENSKNKSGIQNDAKHSVDFPADNTSSEKCGTLVDDKVTTQFPVSQSHLSSLTRDPRRVSVISNGLTPRD
ncbi:hypothetical protein ACOMHN_050243 [Nucella lapillus]